jgi:hypothetical protein
VVHLASVLAGLRGAQAWLSAAVAALRAASGAPLPPAEHATNDRTVATARAALGEDAFVVA